MDDELVDLIHGPSCDEGALGAFVSILTGPPGPRPDHLLTDAISPDLPLLILWGDQDPMTPADGPIGRFFQSLPDTRPASTFTFLPGAVVVGGGAGGGRLERAGGLLAADRMQNRPWGETAVANGPSCWRSPRAAGVGHCPHDDAPDLTHNELLPWLEAVQPPNSR